MAKTPAPRRAASARPDRKIKAKQAPAATVKPGPGGTRDYLVQDIIKRLYDGEYEPGQRLQETQLTATYGVSRGPVREALNALAAMNIVELTPQRGAQLRVLRIEEAIDTLVVAQNLIGLAARLAAQQAPDSKAGQRFRTCLEKLQTFKPDTEGSAFAVARDNFYAALTAMANNTELSRILPTVRVHLIRVQFRSLLRITDSTRLADYQKIAEAVFAGRARQAETAARAHIDRAITRLKSFSSE